MAFPLGTTSTRKPKQRISYVLPLADSSNCHRLGVNSLAIDESSKTLYSAGRDGTICSWNIGVDLSSTAPDTDFISAPPPEPSTLRQQVQAHTHWVNDLALVQSNEALVSCSSDLSVKLWRPSSTDDPHTIGVHDDYVRCLIAPDTHSHWVASGGLDRKIKFWDLNAGVETLEIDSGEKDDNPKGSVYSLGIGGGILASGGPESVVRIWDPRTGQRVTKFVGHTDNIRSILIDDSGDLVLSASSDQTIKLWSLRAGRCLHTLIMHNDSVWSLASSHPGLEVFHSSDRSGLVAKTDVRGVDPQQLENGICAAVCQEQQGVNKVIAAGGYIWTATSSSSISRWVDLDTKDEIGVTRPFRSSTIGSTRSQISQAPASPISTSSKMTSRGGIPMGSLLRISTSSSIPSNVRDPDVVTIYSTNTVQHASMAETMLEENQGYIIPVRELPEETIEGQHGLIKCFLLNDRRRVLALDTAGEVTMWDLMKGVRTKSFGKRHMDDVAAENNTPETVAQWCQIDVRTGRLACILDDNTCFDAEMYADEAGLDHELERDDQRINLGKWVLRYLFASLIDEEIQRDEEYRRQLEVDREDHDKFRRDNAPPMISMPEALFNAIDSQRTRSGSSSTPIAKPGFSLFPPTPGMAIGLATPMVANPASPALQRPETAGESMERASTATSRLSVDKASGDYFSSPAPPTITTNGSTAPTEDPPGSPTGEKPNEAAAAEKEKDSSLFGKWKAFGTKKMRSTSNDMASKPLLSSTGATDKAEVNTIESESSEPDPLEDTLYGVIKRTRATYDAHQNAKSAFMPSLPAETPVLKPPKNTAIILQLEKPSGSIHDLYRGSVGSVGTDADILEKVVPAWLGEVLLLNKVPWKEPMKISFTLSPWKDELPWLPAETPGVEAKGNRLNANRMLRARKVLGYVQERLDKSLWVREEAKPEEWLEVLCNNQVIPLHMTLATIKGHVWRSSNTDIPLFYRRKDRTTAPASVASSASTAVEGGDDVIGEGDVKE